MVKEIQTFLLGLLKASKEQIMELIYFALSVALYLPMIFVVFYFVFIFGMETKVYQLGASTFSLKEIHITLLIAVGVFLWVFVVKYLKTRRRVNEYGIGQVIIRTLLKGRYLMLLTLMVNVLMLKFTLTRINTYGGVLLGAFLVSVYFEAKYNKDAQIEWSDK
jgi:hypothetical protein